MAERASLHALIHRCLDLYADGHRLSPRQWQVCAHIGDCRTAALGGFDWECDACGHHQHLYHACRDRHCPRCQRSASEQWCARQRAAVLPITYYHVVFTLPHDLNPWVEVQPRLLYALLLCTTDRRVDSASSTQRAAPSCARGPAPAFAQMSEESHNSAPCGSREPPMTPEAGSKTRNPASRRCPPLVLHGLAHTPTRNTIPCTGRRPSRNPPAPDSGLGQFNDS